MVESFIINQINSEPLYTTNIMQKLLNTLVIASAAWVLCGCAGTIPVTYTPQNFVRYHGEADIGHFSYKPAEQGKVKPNQLQNTAVGSVYIGVNIAELVQRATALELEKTGFVIGDTHPLQISGEVLEFKADDFGYSVLWTYSIRYTIARKADSTILFDKICTAEPKKTGKFSLAADYSPSINEMILAGYDRFIKDSEVRKIFGQ